MMADKAPKKVLVDMYFNVPADFENGDCDELVFDEFTASGKYLTVLRSAIELGRDEGAELKEHVENLPPYWQPKEDMESILERRHISLTRTGTSLLEVRVELDSHKKETGNYGKLFIEAEGDERLIKYMESALGSLPKCDIGIRDAIKKSSEKPSEPKVANPLPELHIKPEVTDQQYC